MKRAVVDVDGILWDLWKEMSPDLLKLGVPSTLDPPHPWNWHRQYITDKQFYEVVAKAHASQVEKRARPFWGARALISVLRNKKYEIIVASHRTQPATFLARWLIDVGLWNVDGIFTGWDKVPLIRMDGLVIDDNPKTQDAAVSRRNTVLSLDWPWCSGENRIEGVHLFPGLTSMCKWIREEL